MSTLWRFVRGVIDDLLSDDGLSLAAAMAFYTALSFAPLVLLIVAAGGVLGEERKFELMTFFERQLGPQAGDVTAAVVDAAQKESVQQGSWRWYIGIPALLFSASAVFGELQHSLNRVWGVESAPTKGGGAFVWQWLRKRLISIGMVLVTLFVLLVALVITSFISAVLPPGENLLAKAAPHLASFVVAMGLFAAIFKILPDVQFPWSAVWFGAAVTAALFVVGKAVLALYLPKLAGSYSGGAGALIAMLAWVYFSCLILFLGAEITQRWAVSRRMEITPSPHARWVEAK